jgi:multidrug efflux pump subunit AcrA (membrane-fusion protein)
MTRTPSSIDRRGSAALLGLSALVAMGVIGAVAGGTSSDSQTAVVSVGSMSTGETTTLTFSGTIAPVKNVAPVKAPAYGKS